MKFLSIAIWHFFYAFVFSKVLESLDANSNVSFTYNTYFDGTQILDFSNGNWNTLSKGLFNKIQNYSIVLLDHNNFISLPSCGLDSKIVAVDLSYNQLTFLPDEFVCCTDISHSTRILSWLNLGHNKLQYFNVSLKCQHYLQYLLLNNNELFDIESVEIHFENSFNFFDKRMRKKIVLDNNLEENKIDTSTFI